MAASITNNVNPPPQLLMKDNAVEEWRLWKETYADYAIITKLDKESKEFQRAVFLNAAGPLARKVYNTFTFSDQEDKNDVALLMKKFDAHIIGELNETYERYVFNKREQLPDESFDEYLAALRNLAKTCTFCDCMSKTLLRDRIVIGIRDPETRKLLLRKRNLTLNSCIDVCRSNEATAYQLKEMGEKQEIHKVTQGKGTRGSDQGSYKGSSSRRSYEKHPSVPLIRCKFCGYEHERLKEKCPAYGKTCKKCNQENHFAQCCPPDFRKKSYAVDAQYSSDYSDSDQEQYYQEDCELIMTVNTLGESDYSSVLKQEINQAYAVSDKQKEEGPIYAEMDFKSKLIKLQIDCGATVNVMPAHLVDLSKLEPSNVTLRYYNNTLKPVLGKIRLPMDNPATGHKYAIMFQVIDEPSQPLLCRKAAEQMKLITVNYGNFKQVIMRKAQCRPLDQYPGPSSNGDSTSIEKRHVLCKQSSFVQKGHGLRDQSPPTLPSLTHSTSLSEKQKLKEHSEDVVTTVVTTSASEPTHEVNQSSTQEKGCGALRAGSAHTDCDRTKVHGDKMETTSRERLAEIRTLTEEDVALHELKRVIMQGWPESEDKLHILVRPYFSRRSEMTLHDGLIFDRDKVVVPSEAIVIETVLPVIAVPPPQGSEVYHSDQMDLLETGKDATLCHNMCDVGVGPKQVVDLNRKATGSDCLGVGANKEPPMPRQDHIDKGLASMVCQHCVMGKDLLNGASFPIPIVPPQRRKRGRPPRCGRVTY